MNQNDYVILFDENGSPYIAHAGLMDRARGAVNAAANRVQQVANQAKGVGRGVRQNHKYILKVNENGRTRYFYKQEEVKAYYEAKKLGIKNAAEYAQNAVKGAATNVKSAIREATGQAARDRMDAAAAKYPELATKQESAYKAYTDAQKAGRSADAKYANARTERKLAEEKASNSNIFNRKRREANAQTARAQEEQYRSAWNKSVEDETKASQNADKAIRAYTQGMDDYLTNKAAYDKSLAGAVDRTAAKARDVATDIREASSILGKATKQAFRDVSGVTAKQNAEASNKAAIQAQRDWKQAERVAEENRKAYENDKSKKNRNRYYESQSGASKAYQNYADAALQKIIDNSVYRNTALGKAESEAKAAKELGSLVYDKAKDVANNAVTNAKNRFERMKSEFRDKADKAGDAAKATTQSAVDRLKDVSGINARKNVQTMQKALDDAKTAENRAENRWWTNAKEAMAHPSDKTEARERQSMEDMSNKTHERYLAEDAARDARIAYRKTPLAKAEDALNNVKNTVKDIAGYDEREHRNNAQKWVDEARESGNTPTTMDNTRAAQAQKAYNKTPLGMIENARNAISSAKDTAEKARTAVKDKAEDLSAKAKSTAQAAKESAQGMIENARSSTAKAVNEAWDKIPKNSDGTVNPFDSNFQSAYNDWKSKKDKYDGSLTGQAKAAAEKATDSVKDMIDQAKRTARDAAASAQSTIDNATGNNYRKRAQEANQAAENAINQRARTSDQLENQRDKYGSKENDSEHIYGDSEGYYYKTKEQRDRAESLISKRDQYDADIVNNNRASKVNDSMYADSKAGKINSLLGRNNASTSERANSKASEVQNKWARQEAESKLIGGRLDPGINVSKEYVYSRASNSGMAGQVRQVMQLEEAMRDAESAYDRLGNNSSKPQSSSRAARQKMLQAQDAYEKAYKDLIDDINKQYDKDLAAYEKQYGKYNR